MSFLFADLTDRAPHGSTPTDETLRRFGDEWVRAAQTVALLVPSAAIQVEWNILLNPAHPDFSKVRIHSAKPFQFDVRMFR